MVADRVRSQGTLADASPDSTITSNVNAGLDFVDESVARLQSLDGVLDAQQTPGNDSPTFGLFCRFHPNGIIRVTQARRVLRIKMYSHRSSGYLTQRAS